MELGATREGNDRPLPTPIYDPGRSFEDNWRDGPFGAFASPPEPSAPAGEPAESLFGIPLHLPFGISAGPLPNRRFVQAAQRFGFDLTVYKTVRSRRFEGNPWPHILPVKVPGGDLRPNAEALVAQAEYSFPLAITNSFGVPSFAPDAWQPDLAQAVRETPPGQLVIASFQGTLPEPGEPNRVAAYMADFGRTAALVKETGARVLEVNLSCPNEGTAHLLCFDAEHSRLALDAIREQIGSTPLIVKIAYFEKLDEEDSRLREFLKTIGGRADAIGAINTISAPIVDDSGNQALPGPGRLYSGVGGEPIRWAGVEMTRRLVQLREELGLKFRIVATGGCALPADYQVYRSAGADAVLSATAAMWNPEMAHQINALERQGQDSPIV